MSQYSDFIVNLTNTLKNKVDEGSISEDIMLNILKDTIYAIQPNKIQIYTQINVNDIKESSPAVSSINSASTAVPKELFKVLWSETMDSDDDIDEDYFNLTSPESHNLDNNIDNNKHTTNNSNIIDNSDKNKQNNASEYQDNSKIIKCVSSPRYDNSNKDYSSYTSSYHTTKRQLYQHKRPYYNNYNNQNSNYRHQRYDNSSSNSKLFKVQCFQKFEKNCENTFMNFINNYKINHFDSAKTLYELNLIIVRLLGLNLNDEVPTAYSNVCWFMRNTKCYYDECIANGVFMCSYAHPKACNKQVQYCCIDSEEYEQWPDNYYKCLKTEYDDEISESVKKYKYEKLPLQDYKKIPDCIIEWYDYMCGLIEESQSNTNN
jgi:hypothetical protein